MLIFVCVCLCKFKQTVCLGLCTRWCMCVWPLSSACVLLLYGCVLSPDGLMVQITVETMAELRRSLREMKDYTVTCGRLDQSESQELVCVQWVEEKSTANKGWAWPQRLRFMLQPLTEALVLDENNVRFKNSSVEIRQRASTRLQKIKVSYQDDALIYNKLNRWNKCLLLWNSDWS